MKALSAYDFTENATNTEATKDNKMPMSHIANLRHSSHK